MTASHAGAWLLLFALLAGCSSGGSSGTGMAGNGAGATGGAAGNATGGSGGSGTGGNAGASGSGGAAGSGATAGTGSGGGTPGSWSVIETDELYGTKAVAGHPSDPNRVAFLVERSPAAPGMSSTVAVARSMNGGAMLEFAQIMDIPQPAYFDAHGFVTNPESDQQLAAAIGFPYGFEYQDLWRLLRSGDGGKSFSVTSIVQLSRLKWVPGNPGALVAAVNGQIQKSTDFGQSFGAPEPAPSGCTTIFDYTESPTQRVFACGDAGIQVCQGTSCQAASLPANTGTSHAVESIPADATRIVALAGSSSETALLLSTDGGGSFQSVQALGSDSAWRLHVDPRPDGAVIIAHGLVTHALWRSIDGGGSFAEVTPPMTLPNAAGLSTYAYEVAVVADGGIVAYTAPGILRLAP